MKTIMKLSGTLVLLFLTTSYTLAEDGVPEENLKQYDVEIIIFEDAHARYLTSEKWKQNIKMEDLATAETEANEVTEHQDNLSPENLNQSNLSIEEISIDRFQPIKPEILNKQYKRINVSSEYNVLFYSAWRQAGLDKNNAFEINITELENAHISKSENTLSGTFKLVLSRYLHIYNQLDYQRVVAAVAQGSAVMSMDGRPWLHYGAKSQEGGAINELNQLNIYPLNSHRRMRSKELHYIDHPLVGMLIQINPVEKTIKTKDQDPTT